MVMIFEALTSVRPWSPLSTDQTNFPTTRFWVAIRDGVSAHNWEFGPMPAIGGLDDDEITAIITHIRGVQEREGFEPYPPE